ncbi:MAG: hypothetical protein HY655_05255 [Acidobacteria bacterium]|nr:hypothetical protein [Acidobacteriota bacterium]
MSSRRTCWYLAGAFSLALLLCVAAGTWPVERAGLLTVTGFLPTTIVLVLWKERSLAIAEAIRASTRIERRS